MMEDLHHRTEQIWEQGECLYNHDGPVSTEINMCYFFLIFSSTVALGECEQNFLQRSIISLSSLNAFVDVNFY